MKLFVPLIVSLLQALTLQSQTADLSKSHLPALREQKANLNPQEEKKTSNGEKYTGLEICSESENEHGSQLFHELLSRENATRSVPRTRIAGSAPYGTHLRDGYETVVDKDRHIQRLSPSFDEKISTLLSWALKCRASRGADSKPTWIEIELIKQLNETLPNALMKMRIDRNASRGVEYSSILATFEFREDVLFLKQLSATYDHLLKVGFKDPKFSMALAEQLDEYSKARKENREPVLTDKLKDYAKELRTGLASKSKIQNLSDGHRALARMLLQRNPFNDSGFRKDPPLFDTIFSNFLGASYRALVFLDEMPSKPNAQEFSWHGIPLSQNLVHRHLKPITENRGRSKLRNSLRSSRGHSPNNEEAPFWADEIHEFAVDLYQLSWNEREKLRSWAIEQIGLIQTGETSQDPLVLETLVQMLRIIDSSVDGRRPNGSRVSKHRPDLEVYYPSSLREAKTAADPTQRDLFKDLDAVRKVYESETNANFGAEARWKFLTLPTAERIALKRWSRSTKDKDLLKRLLSNPNRTDLIAEANNNLELAHELYESLESELKDGIKEWDTQDKVRLSQIIQNLKNLNVGTPQEQLNRFEQLRADAEAIREVLGSTVVSLSEKASQSGTYHSAAEAASVIYNRLFEIRLGPKQVRQLDVVGVNSDGRPTEIIDHYSHEITAQLIRSNGPGLFTNEKLNKFIEEIYGKGAVIHDSTRKLLGDLLKNENALHQTMLRRIKDIIEHRKTLAQGESRTRVEEFWRALLVRPEPHFIESILKQLNEDAFRLYADVEQYQQLRKDLVEKIKSDPSKLSPLKITSNDFFALAKYAIAQTHASQGMNIDRVLSDAEINERVTKDLISVGRDVENLLSKTTLNESEKAEVHHLNNTLNAAGFHGANNLRSIVDRLKQVVQSNENGLLSDEAFRFALLLNVSFGQEVNARYQELALQTAKGMLLESHDPLTRKRVGNILKSQLGQSELSHTELDQKLEDLEKSVEFQRRLIGQLGFFEAEDLSINLYRKRFSDFSKLSDGIEGYYDQLNILRQIDLNHANKRLDHTVRDLYSFMYSHREDPDKFNEKLEALLKEDERKHGSKYPSKAKADLWLKGLNLKEREKRQALKTVKHIESEINKNEDKKNSEINKVIDLESILKDVSKYLLSVDGLKRKEILSRSLSGENEWTKAIVSVLKSSNGKEERVVLDEIAQSLSSLHLALLKGNPVISSSNNNSIEKGYQDLVHSVHKIQKELGERSARRNDAIEKILNNSFSDLFEKITDPQSKDLLYHALGQEIIDYLIEKGHLEEQIRLYGLGMQTNLDISPSRPNDSAANLTKSYNTNVGNLLREALGSGSKPIAVTDKQAHLAVKKSLDKAVKDREQNDSKFVEALNKFKAIGGEFDGISAVVSNHTDLSLIGSESPVISGAKEAEKESCDPLDRDLFRSNIAYKLKCSGWAFNGNKILAGNRQLEEVLSQFTQSGVNIKVDLPGIRDFQTTNVDALLKRIARDLAIEHGASAGSFLMPLNKTTAIQVKIDSETGRLEYSYSNLEKEQEGLKKCIDAVNTAYDEHFKTTKYAKSWGHTFARLSENIFWRQSLLGAGDWSFDGFGAELQAYNEYIRSIERCRRYGTVSVGENTGQDFSRDELNYRAPVAVFRASEMVKEFSYKVDVVNDAGWLVVGTVATFGAGGLLNAGAAGTRAALAANGAAKLNSLERLAFNATNVLSKSGAGKKITEGALRSYDWALPYAQQALWGRKALEGGGTKLVAGGFLREAAFGQILNTLSLPAYGAMNWELSRDYAKAEELYRKGEFTLAGFGGDQEKWSSFKQTVDTNSNGIPDSIDSIGAQWVYPDASTVDGWLGSSINFGTMGGLGPVTRALHIPHRLHLPLFAGGAIDGLRGVAHGRTTWADYGNHRLDSFIHLGPGLIAMEMPLASKLLSGVGKKVGKSNFSDRRIFSNGPTVGRLGDTFTTYAANHYGGQYALEFFGRSHKSNKEPSDRSWLDWVAMDLPNFGQDLYFAYKMAGSAQNQYLKRELKNLSKAPEIEGKRPSDRLKELEKGYGKEALRNVVASLPVSEILRARTENTLLFKMATELNPHSKISPNQLYEALEIFQNRENSEVLKKRGIDAKKLYKEGNEKKPWWNHMGSGLGAASNWVDTLSLEKPIREALPQILAEHIGMVQRAYKNTNDIEFRSQLSKYLRKNPLILDSMPISFLNIRWTEGLVFEDLADKEKMDMKLLYDIAATLSKEMISGDKRGDNASNVNAFAIGFIRYAVSQRDSATSAHKTLGQLILEYRQLFNNPAEIMRRIDELENKEANEFFSRVNQYEI